MNKAYLSLTLGYPSETYCSPNLASQTTYSRPPFLPPALTASMAVLYRFHLRLCVSRLSSLTSDPSMIHRDNQSHQRNEQRVFSLRLGDDKEQMYWMLVAGRTARLGSVLDDCGGFDLCMLSGRGCERRLGVMGWVRLGSEELGCSGDGKGRG